jgi:thioredoxin 1
VVKLDVDEAGDVAGQYGVQSIPTLILFKDGQPVERLVGNYPKPAILSKIQQHL